MAKLTEEEEILTFDVSDEALEIAGSDKTNFTWGVCTLDQPGCFPSIFVGDQNTHGIAAECRRLVASVSRPEDKQALETLARAWDRIPDEREARLWLDVITHSTGSTKLASALAPAASRCSPQSAAPHRDKLGRKDECRHSQQRATRRHP
jgi:hypothetical protein